MVRVISVHHFDSQSIQTCEDPVAVTTAPPDRLLVALTHHVIEVRDLSNKGEPTFSFPTVDQVCYMLYCSTGNYVATLENKVSRQGRETIYTRIYANWEKTNEEQSMRARIAGRVTPSSSQTGGDVLEMIELPVKFPTTTAIACCQATGNLLVSCQTALCLFQLVSRTHDISRQRFLDFELWPVTLELSFAPLYLAMVEDVVAAMDSQSLHVFRINKGVTRASDWSERSSSSGSPSLAQNSADKKKAVKKEKRWESKKFEEPIDLDALVNDINSPARMLFPSIEATKNDHQHLPFKPILPGTMGVAVKEMPTNEPWAEQMTTMVESLLQLQVTNEQLHCLVLRPLYTTTTSPISIHSECPRLRSASYSRLLALNCVIATHQEAYLYHFPVENGDTVGLGYCISVYSFTSPVSHICLEPYMLHALTSTGLETYTMRSAHAVYNKLGPVSTEDPICLVGLRPFIGAVDLLISQSQLVVLSSSDDHSSWTVYSLQLPSSETLYEDMVAVATSHQYSVSGTYRHLISEAHAVLYTAQFLSTSPTATKIPTSPAYVTSCQRLADLFHSSNIESDWRLGVMLSDEVEDTPAAVFTRLQTLQTEAKQRNVHVDIGPGLAHYIQHCLTVSQQQQLWLPPAALECLPSYLLAGLLLQSQRLRESTTERHIETLRKHLQNNKSPTECLAATVLCVERGQTDEAKILLSTLHESSSDVMNCLLQHWTLLLDNMRQVGTGDDKNRVLTFSDMGVLLMMAKPRLLASILAAVVTNKHEMDLQQVLQVFLAYLPSRMGVAGTAASSVLQGFLEHVLIHEGRPNISHPPTREALQILMRSYLSDLRVNPKGVPGGHNPFPGKRPIFLHLLPPFAVPEHISLIKLEWLMYNGWLDIDCLNELTQYVNEVLPTCLSLKVLAQQNGAILLIDQCPLAVLQYVKEMLKSEAQLRPFLIHLEEITENDTTGTYAPILKDVLDYLTESLSPEALYRVLPGGTEKKLRYKSHLATCQQLAHANHIHSVIIATARQLITTLNL